MTQLNAKRRLGHGKDGVMTISSRTYKGFDCDYSVFPFNDPVPLTGVLAGKDDHCICVVHSGSQPISETAGRGEGWRLHEFGHVQCAARLEGTFWGLVWR